MSIAPFTNFGGSWDPESFLDLDLWNPFEDAFPSPFSSLNTQVTRKETSAAHVFRAVFPGTHAGGAEVEVLLHIDDDNVLQISTEDGAFAARFKLPENSSRDGVRATMAGRILTVTVPKITPTQRNRNVRTIEISGSG